MELTPTQHGLLEDMLLASNWSSFDHQDQDFATLNSSTLGSLESGYAFPPCEEFAYFDGLAIPPEFDPSFDHCKSYHNLPPIPIPFPEEHDQVVAVVEENRKAEEAGAMPMMDASEPKTGSSKETERQPSKNLMAERRRRKRLNDRLSMLRSIVPRISKMDRTSILGGAIDYMKDLLDKIHKLSEEDVKEDKSQMHVTRSFKEATPHEVLAAGQPKFDVERRSVDTRIQLRCNSKPGILSSTLSTIEALGLDIQHCVISCFNDFSLQATCSEMAEHRRILASEDVKQAFVRNAGCGGRCQ